MECGVKNEIITVKITAVRGEETTGSPVAKSKKQLLGDRGVDMEEELL